MTDPRTVDHDCRSRENASIHVDVNTGFENQVDDSAAQVNENDNLEDHQIILEANGIVSARNYEDGRYIMNENEATEGALNFAALHSDANINVEM